MKLGVMTSNYSFCEIRFIRAVSLLCAETEALKPTGWYVLFHLFIIRLLMGGRVAFRLSVWACTLYLKNGRPPKVQFW